jgi:cobalt/nickel transport system permease protein
LVHIVDGVLSAPVLVAGAAVAVAGVARGLRDLEPERLPAVGMTSAAFFVSSLIHVPIGPSSVHLILNGLAGIMLGWAAFPAILVGLILQAIFFGYGGITVLGVNTVAIAGPAVVCAAVCGAGVRRGSPFWWGAIAGAAAVAMTCAAVGLALAVSGREFLPAARLVFVAHLPIMLVEAAVTGAAVTLLRKVKPEALTWKPVAAEARRA